MRIEPLCEVVGAEVLELDPGAELDQDTVAALDAAFVRHGVLLFRGGPLGPAELVAFSACFGALQPHVQRAYQHPEVPEVVVMTNRKPDGSFDEAGARRGAIENTRDGWHSDLSYDASPAKATLLHAVEIPSRGGNTCFVNAHLAYLSLPEDMRERISGLEAEFVYGGHQRNPSLKIAAATLDAQAQRTARAIHPVVSAHPVTGLPAIYANPALTTRVLGVSGEESEEILAAIADALDRPELRWEHRWSVGDTLMWENRGGVMHTGRLDYPREEARRFIRTTVSGGPILAYRAAA
jgi:taurine dioxygenase